MRLIDKNLWGRISYLLIEHGRRVCTAKKPRCGVCIIGELCPSRKKFINNEHTADKRKN